MVRKDLFHVREAPLQPGSLIQPGRWGSTILAEGKAHPFFCREQLLDVWRVLKTNIQVSRVSCTFAHEGLKQAEAFAQPGEVVLRVVPVNLDAPSARLDMLWLTWLGEPGATTDKIMSWCSGYWSGRPTTDLKQDAIPWWEWLFACPLMVIGDD